MHKKIARPRTFVLSASSKAKYREVGTRKCRSKHLSPNRGTGLRVRRATTEDASPGTALRVHARRKVRRAVRTPQGCGALTGWSGSDAIWVLSPDPRRVSSETPAWPAVRRAPSAEHAEGIRRSVFLVKHHRLVRISRSGTVPFGACPCTMPTGLPARVSNGSPSTALHGDADAGFRTRGADSGSPFGAYPVSAATLLRGIRHRAPAHGVRSIGRTAR